MFSTAFGAYAKHETELEYIINEIVNHVRRTGDIHFSIPIDDDLSPKDIEYIKEKVSERL